MINIGICGYGNLGKGVEAAISLNEDMKLVAVFTRRSPDSIKLQTPNAGVYSMKDMAKFKDQIDVMILCGGSATDLPTQTPEIARMFNVVDSFDTHAKVYEHFLNVDKDAINYFNEHVFVDNFSVQKIYNKVFLQGDTRVVIGSTDESFFKLGNVDILYGRMPIKKGEVAIEEEYLNILEVERVGDVIPNDSKVEMLRGYSVCGIVENYSRTGHRLSRGYRFFSGLFSWLFTAGTAFG